MKLEARQLRKRKPTPQELAKIKRRPIYLVLDNVLDTYNIGGLFRLADAVAAKKVILCGESETPPSSRIHKAAVGTEEWVPWEYVSTVKEAVEKLKNQNSNIKIIAVEQSEKSIPYTEIGKWKSTRNREAIGENGDSAIAIVVGHETEGVSKNVLDIADLVVEIPLFGVNRSLNVIVSGAIVLYKILEKS